jgi:hypothetical protein
MITPAVTPLRQRMLEDMRMRKLEPKTQEAYIRAVRKLAAHLKRSPETATVEDLRNFQLHLVDTGTSPITLNATLRSAHLSSTFKRMFGLTASDLLALGVAIDVSEDIVLSECEHPSQPKVDTARGA